MRRTTRLFPTSDARGTSLVELMVALIVLAIGITAVGHLFPAVSRGQVNDRMMTVGSHYAQDKLEQLGPLRWSHPDLAVGRHPAGLAAENLGHGQWRRWYEVEILPAPLNNLKKVTVVVDLSFLGSRSITATTYVRR